MKTDLRGYRVAFFGGDRRELAVADRFHRLGAEIRSVGLPWPDDVSFVENVPEEVAAWAHVLVFPVGGTDEFGNVLYSIVPEVEHRPRLTEDLVRRMQRGAVIFIGKAEPFLRRWCEAYGVRLVEFRERDDFATRNAVPSAEGAVQLAMENTDVTLHGSAAFVLGYGRLGTVLAQALRGLGAATAVFARAPSDRARAEALGHPAFALEEIGREIARADVVFNTVPALVLREAVLRQARQSLVVVDLASPPGGTDFLAAKKLGLKALLAPGLPGIVAPRTAGMIVADTILTILDEGGFENFPTADKEGV